MTDWSKTREEGIIRRNSFCWVKWVCSYTAKGVLLWSRQQDESPSTARVVGVRNYLLQIGCRTEVNKESCATLLMQRGVALSSYELLDPLKIGIELRVQEAYFELKWYEVYDFIEFYANVLQLDTFIERFI